MSDLYTPRRGCYPVTLRSGGSHNPTFGNTYFWGSAHAAAPATSGAIRQQKIIKGGRIVAAYLSIVSGGGGGSNESADMLVRVNDTTDSTLISAVNWDTTTQFFSATGLSIPVATGDYVEVKVTVPNWATPPTAVVYVMTLNIEVP